MRNVLRSSCYEQGNRDDWTVDSEHRHYNKEQESTKNVEESKNAGTDSSDEDEEFSDDDEDEMKTQIQYQGELSENDYLANMRLTAQFRDCKQRFRVLLRPGLMAKTLVDVALSLSDEIPLHYEATASHFLDLLITSAGGGESLKTLESATNNKTSDFDEDETFERFENFLSSLPEEMPSMEGLLTGLQPIRDSDTGVVDGPTQHLGSRAIRLFEAIKIRDVSLLKILIGKFYQLEKYVCIRVLLKRDI